MNLKEYQKNVLNAISKTSLNCYYDAKHHNSLGFGDDIQPLQMSEYLNENPVDSTLKVFLNGVGINTHLINEKSFNRLVKLTHSMLIFNCNNEYDRLKALNEISFKLKLNTLVVKYDGINLVVR